VVIAGNGHVVFNFGIPKRVYRRTPLPLKTIVLKAWEEDLGDDKDLTFASGGQPPGDYLWITRPNPPEKKGPRIGIVLLTGSRDQDGLEIERVIPGSPAEKAGLLPGDRLKAVEGKEISALREIHEALAEKGWGKEITLTIIRQGEQKEVTVALPSRED
jgi:membrane-associated protease RseP (regulator of RpoE activity)